MTVVGYSFAEALVSLRRSGRSALVSIGTIAIAFVTLGGFLLITWSATFVYSMWSHRFRDDDRRGQDSADDEARE